MSDSPDHPEARFHLAEQGRGCLFRHHGRTLGAALPKTSNLLTYRSINSLAPHLYRQGWMNTSGGKGKEKTEVCRNFAAGKTCKYGEKCKFAHVKTDSDSAPMLLSSSQQSSGSDTPSNRGHGGKQNDAAAIANAQAADAAARAAGHEDARAERAFNREEESKARARIEKQAQEALEIRTQQNIHLIEKIEGVVVCNPRQDQMTGILVPRLPSLPLSGVAVGLALCGAAVQRARKAPWVLFAGAAVTVGVAAAIWQFWKPRVWIRGMRATIAGPSFVAHGARVASDAVVESRPSVVIPIMLTEATQWYRPRENRARPWQTHEYAVTTTHTSERPGLLHLGMLGALRRSFDFTVEPEIMRQRLDIQCRALASSYVIPIHQSQMVPDTRDYAFVEYLHGRQTTPVVPRLGSLVGGAF